jgi:DNA-binding NarL/FixJ family response regulator
MNIAILTPVRLLGDALESCLKRRPDFVVQAVVGTVDELHAILGMTSVDLVLVDVTQGMDLEEIRAIAAERPGVALIALGLEEQRQAVIRCGRAGFAGYVAREATIDVLYQSMLDVAAGRLTCSAEISGGLLRALFRREAEIPSADLDEALTRREGEVLHLIGRGMSNKEIARELSLSVATVKHHVHNILDKLHLPGRTQVMRRVRAMPWLAESDALPRRRNAD